MTCRFRSNCTMSHTCDVTIAQKYSVDGDRKHEYIHVNEFQKLESIRCTIIWYESVGIEICYQPKDVTSIIIPNKYTLSLIDKQFIAFIQGLEMTIECLSILFPPS